MVQHVKRRKEESWENNCEEHAIHIHSKGATNGFKSTLEEVKASFQGSVLKFFFNSLHVLRAFNNNFIHLLTH